MIRSLRHRNFRLFFFGQGVSLIGTWMQSVAMPWLVYTLTGSAMLLGVVGFTGQILTFVMAPVAGVMADRWNRHRLVLWAQVLATAQALALAALTLTGAIEVWHIIVVSLFAGLVRGFEIPARQAFVIEMLEDRRDLPNAIALNSLMVNGTRLVGPALAGAVIAVAGEGWCFLLNGLSFLAVIAALLAMRVRPRAIEPAVNNVLQDMKEGVLYAARSAPIRSVLLLLCLVSLMGVPYTVLMPIFAKDILRGDSYTMGFLLGSVGVGAVCGALLLASRKNVDGLGRTIALAAGAFGAGLVAFSMSRSFWLSLPLLAWTGFGMMMQMASSNTLLQTIVEENKRGRVMSFYTMAFMGMAPFGSLLAGGLAEALGAPRTVLLGGLVTVAGALVFAARLPRLRGVAQPAG
ncbi:MAG: MFS transporter [Planctomycetes bacterium]|nr:MFS transporter [Planctomycetota bacterium]